MTSRRCSRSANDGLAARMAIPVKPEYGPTLGRLLEPRWRAAPAALRALTIAAGVAMLALAVGIVLYVQPSSYSHGGTVPFHLQYRGLDREPAQAGELLRLSGRYSDGRLKYSYVVGPLRLPAYAGVPTGVLAVYATAYIRARSLRIPEFELEGEGRTRVNGVPGYQVLYTGRVDGEPVYGRDVLLLPEKPGAREGVTIEMIASRTASKEVDGPSEVASAGALLRPVKTFTF